MGIEMKKTFKSNDISCGSCANLIKVSLEEEYGEIEVNLETKPREVIVDIKDENQEVTFKKELEELGFKIVGE